MVHGLDEQSIEISNFPKGKVLFKQGDKGDAAYIVNSGAIGIYRESQGRKIPLATVRKGELFGEMAVIDGSPRMATAFTLEDSTLMVVSLDIMIDKMRRADPFIKALISMLMGNLRGVHDTYQPKSRSLLDAVNTLARHVEIVSRFMQGNLSAEFRAELEAKLKTLDVLVKDLRRVAVNHREDDRRDDAVPSEADLPTS
jgi:CRP/FNR family cyclic AMP-dependent transcriptional regulator